MYAKAIITSDVIFCHIDCVWLVKQVLQFSTFQLLYMTLAVDKMDRLDLSNTACREYLPRKLR